PLDPGGCAAPPLRRRGGLVPVAAARVVAGRPDAAALSSSAPLRARRHNAPGADAALGRAPDPAGAVVQRAQAWRIWDSDRHAATEQAGCYRLTHSSLDEAAAQIG